MPPVVVAALQMISGPDVGPNLDTAGRLIADAAAAGAQLVALPEYFPLIGARDAERLAARERDALEGGGGPIQDFLSDAARRHGVWVVGGSIPFFARDPGKMRNTSLVFDATGQRVARYDKIHLFGFRKGSEAYDESAVIEAGDTPVTFDTPWGRVGLAICYDLRFPELFRRMGEIDLLILPSAFTDTTGRAHWEMLLRARAVENQCYVLAPAQGGRHPNGRVTFGNSLLVDPWGEVVARMDKGEGVVLGNVDPARIAEVRTQLPALGHRTLI